MSSNPPTDDDLVDDDGPDEALSWGDERDASYVAGPAAAPDSPSTDSDPSTGSGTDDEDAPAATSSFLLVSYGILAGVYGLYTIGWLTSVLRGSGTMSTVLGEIMFQLGEFLSIAAPPLWFASVLFLTRGRKPIVRLGWLVVGLVLLVPIPFIMGS
ncbi:hypothetical protein HD599_002355 [Conyzicola lurida]|uniref:DNA polymerase III subunit gamma/tau n=1 Tax=Conyzicola lurida TaxID=1172621 RepID=A0A841APZ9_9MICO|nr:hypothetical protein [Conyzicola lurida]MBB5844032.1 hypothetical protein [Conyzicola lurida]